MRKAAYHGTVTTYSDVIAGDEMNYNWTVRFDNTGPADYVAEPG
jgi:hypothetical protein